MPTLNWIGKEKVINHHRYVPFKILEHKYGFNETDGETDTPVNSGNKIIHGDNLEARKSLLPEYEGKIKCIYIDPPYNTGNENCVYKDNVNHTKIKKWLEATLKAKEIGKEAAIGIDDLARHNKWLCMMYPRLKLLQKLLADDGAIFISIDDEESQPLVKRTNSVGILQFPAKKVTSKLKDGVYPKGKYGKGTSSVTLLNDIIITEQIKDPIVEYILAKPKEGQIKVIAHQLVQIVGDMYPIPDQEIRVYVERILKQLNTEQLQDILVRKLSYSDKIKAKIRLHADSYAEGQFNDLIKIRKIVAEPIWNFPEMIVQGQLGASIGHSLYEREGAMNNFETTVITDIASLPNIAFWHRNLGRGKGFSINGFKFNHYPDFIVVSKSGKIIIVETKGDDRDNSDSDAKCRLGNKWAELAGKDFLYFMVFDKKAIEGAYTVDKAKKLIQQL